MLFASLRSVKTPLIQISGILVILDVIINFGLNL